MKDYKELFENNFDCGTAKNIFTYIGLFHDFENSYFKSFMLCSKLAYGPQAPAQHFQIYNAIPFFK